MPFDWNITNNTPVKIIFSESNVTKNQTIQYILDFKNNTSLYILYIISQHNVLLSVANYGFPYSCLSFSLCMFYTLLI